MCFRSITQLALLSTSLTLPLYAQSTMNLNALADSYANASRSNKNYGESIDLTLRSGNKIAFLKFEVPELPGAILSAELQLYAMNAASQIGIHNVDDDSWQENTLNWDLKPDHTLTAATSGALIANAYNTFDVSSLVNSSGVHSLALLYGDKGNIDISSRETNFQPILHITYDDSNVAPNGSDDEFYVIHDTDRTISGSGVLSNDQDPNGDTLTAKLQSAPTRGSVTLNADGSFVYTPTPGEFGVDSFTYVANDGYLDSAPVTVTLYLRGYSFLLPSAELDKLEGDLGIDLSLDQELDLIWAVNPPPADSSRLNQSNARIEQHRKSDFSLNLLDSNGVPLTGASVSASLKKRQFRFGGVLSLKHFAGANTDGLNGQAYKDKIKTYFDAVGLMNGLKPKLSAGNEQYLPDFFQWCQQNDVPVRGHLLLWPGGNHLSAEVEAKTTAIEQSEDPTEIATLTAELRTLVDNEITTWAATWDVYEWDVLNEILSNQRLQNIFGDAEMIRWFSLAQQNMVDPNADLLLNDYQIISCKEESRIAAYKERLDYLVNNGAAITAIGFQSRYKWRHEDPETLYNRLDQFSSYNMKLVGTEFEIKTSPGVFEPNEYTRARMTAETMTAYLSHPKVTSLFAWDFGKDYSERALLDSSGNPKLNGLVWYYLNRIRFTSAASTDSDADGMASFRGFHGEYEVTVEHEGRSFTTNINLTDGSAQEVNLPFSGTVSSNYAPSEDTFVYDNNETLTPYNWQRFDLRTDPDGPYSRIAYLKFDLSQMSGEEVSTILRLYSEVATTSLSIYQVDDSSWNQETLNWTNKPDLGTLLATVSTQDNTWVEIPLNFADNPGVITLAIINNLDQIAKVSSSESSNPPSLVTTEPYTAP
ncbi:Endo-1,4-beta-xylanase, GH35 family [Rubritalea squalenifaciens DSM 18772]|uniref:Endo-1,4-beta-xylanase, GH35 family n=2 Tax=Rubritalea squalenifaciens TaxID=407226 RepID=A0A1M6E1D8_9BACT|nr:Endo-1,4-beta-xylanase, GH35 family [Rubritalea squalenifaciens DSM 18772]